MIGLTVCRTHGGYSKQAQETNQRVKAGRRIKYKVGQLGALLDDAEFDEANPTEGLMEAVRRAGALMRVYGSLVSELSVKLEYEPRDIPGHPEPVLYPSSMLGLDRYQEAAVHVLVKEYRSSVEHYAKICKIALDAGIAAAEIRVKAHQAQLLATAMQAVQRAQLASVRAILEAQGLDAEAVVARLRVEWPTLLRRHMLEVPTSAMTEVEQHADVIDVPVA
jgi:hypothetical protein